MQLKKAENGWFYLECTKEERFTPKKAGFWWNTQACPNKWSTKDIEKAYLLRDFADEDLKAELCGTMKEKAESIESSRAMDADVEIPKPDGLDYLPFQKAGIAYAMNHPSTLIGDEMGCGKSIEVLGVINATHPKNVLVICPDSLRLNWIYEARKWLVHDYEIYEVQGTKDEIPASANFIVTSYERVEAKGLDRDYELAVIDECQKIKNPQAKITKKLVGYWDKKERKEQPGLLDRASRCLYLTGTPIPNRPIEMWTVLHKCDPKNFNSFMGYAKRYCGAMQTRYGWDMSGASNLEELQKKLRSSCMVRRLKKDVLKELPPKRRQIVVLPTNGCAKVVKAEQEAWAKQEKILEELQLEVEEARLLDDKELYNEAVSKLNKATRHAFVEISGDRHETALAKVPEFIDYAKDTLDSVGKVIIFAHHLDVVDQICEGLKEYNPVLLTGPMKADDRQKSVETFQNDENCKVFIGTIGAAGVGLTLTAASTVLFAELDWVPGNVTQAEDRAYRIGQVNSVNVVHVVLDGSLDQKMAVMLINKQEVADCALDKGNVQVDLESKVEALPVVVFHKYSDDVRKVTLRALREVAMRCDGALMDDGVGYNGCDSRIGKSLASFENLSDKQTALALRILRKYSGQLSRYLGDSFSTLQEVWNSEKSDHLIVKKGK